MQSPYGYLRVVEVTDNYGTHCPECERALPRTMGVPHYAEHINHFLDHGYEILSTCAQGSQGILGEAVLARATLLGKPRRLRDLLREADD